MHPRRTRGDLLRVLSGGAHGWHCAGSWIHSGATAATSDRISAEQVPTIHGSKCRTKRAGRDWPESNGRGNSGRDSFLGVGAVYCGQYAKGLAHLVHHGDFCIVGVICRPPWHGICRTGNLHWDFSRSTRSSTPSAPQKQFRMANLPPILSGLASDLWRRTPARNVRPRAPRFPLAPPC